MPISQTTADDSQSATAGLFLAKSLTCLLFCAAVFTGTTAEAQGSKKKKPSEGHGAPGAGAPAMSPPAGMRSYGGPEMYGQGGTSIKKKGPAKRKAKPTEPLDPEKLPEEYHVPPEPTEALT